MYNVTFAAMFRSASRVNSLGAPAMQRIEGQRRALQCAVQVRIGDRPQGRDGAFLGTQDIGKP
jgi:hypothetical protein